MTNQMKKILMVCLIMSYVNFSGLLITLIISGFTYKYFFTYIFLGLSVALCVYFQYLQILIEKEDREFAMKIYDAKKLLELRELAKLRFYKSRGLEPQYNEDGTVMDPDTFIGILTKLDENGDLEKSIYEILGIEPVFDKDGKEVPVIVVLKHLMKKPKTSGLDKVKGISKKMVAKGTQKTLSAPEKKEEKKKVAAQTAPQKENKSKKEKAAVYAKYIRAKQKAEAEKQPNTSTKADNKTEQQKTPKPQSEGQVAESQPQAVQSDTGRTGVEGVVLEAPITVVQPTRESEHEGLIME